MSVLYGFLEMPKKIKRDKEASSGKMARFIAEPFERGYGHTIGNALRRMLLTSIEAPAICSIHLEGVPHEYTSVPGIIEDMTNVVLNFKGSLLRSLNLGDEVYVKEPKIVTSVLDITEEMLRENGGSYAVTLGMVVKSGDFDVINPDHHLFTVTQPMKKQLDLRVTVGRGYVPSERHQIEGKIVDEILIDSCFSPVTLVNYYVENTRVGQHTDYDRLILDITTDGRVTPEEALSFVAQIGMKHLEVFAEVKEEELTFDVPGEDTGSDRDVLMQKLSLRIDEIELSVRSTNCLQGASIETIAELVIKPESEMLKFRNFGKKSLNEIRAKLTEMGLSLGMDLSKYGITEDNVKDVIEQYIQEQQQEEFTS